eukprot:CAMPEP_0204842812 /NCGR_PEP_ID=MMETSP1346-20131115/47602_1 /ASSEMBLY_ACC=CAM_ASM_000771 /TAXON_ID=215587 /ORGANISM="Aplanochytrium stocchinoi, Strain GSBS06" /LENGTH=125 /DNA_ID=CAMNT_0051981845 /DNA_START=1833 /DNA_END=2210 /DNA_ORIENTATION=-
MTEDILERAKEKGRELDQKYTDEKGRELDQKYTDEKGRELDQKYTDEKGRELDQKYTDEKGRELDQKYTDGKYAPVVVSAYNDGVRMVTERLEGIRSDFEETKQAKAESAHNKTDPLLDEVLPDA